MKRKISILLLVLTILMNPMRLMASEKEDEVGEYNDEVFKVVDKDGNVSDMPVDEDVVIMPTYNADPTTVSYGVVNLRTKPSAAYNTYYTDANTGKTGYINGYASSEAAFLGLSADKKQVKFKISNMIGWVDASEVQVINYKDCKSISYYELENGFIYHYGTTDVSGTDYIIQNNIGPAPSYLVVGKKYYSYDGHYFYTSFEKMIADYKAGVYTNSVNPDKAYWNYYQYLPSRSVTSLTASQLNSYIPSYAKNGKMANIGQTLIDAQNTYGVNAVLMFAQAAFESGWGMSSIAQDKNNLFGHGAADNNPYYGANGYSSVKDCVTYHAKVVLSEGFFDPKDVSGRYYGSHCGDKSSGIVVKYCSDPYWGEKVASMCWSMERLYGTFESKTYTLGIKESNKVCNIYSDENKSKVLFNTGNFLNYPVIILGEGSMYKIQSDSTLNADRSSIVQDNGVYHFNNDYGYIEKDGITIVSKGNNSSTTSNQKVWVKRNNQWFYQNSNGSVLKGWQQYNGNWYYLDLMDGHMLTGWQSIQDNWYYFESNGTMCTGWKKINNKWYYMNQKGVMQTGFVDIEDKTYYFMKNGSMETGWQEIEGNWYYFGSNGSMYSNQWVGSYYLDEDGKMCINSWIGSCYVDEKGKNVQGWKQIEDKWYYFIQGSGKYVSGWLKVNGLWYYFDDSGIMYTGFMEDNGYTYYLNSSMKVGWHQIDSAWYYFDKSGHMITSKWIGNYYLSADGTMATNTWIGKYYVDDTGKYDPSKIRMEA